MQANVEICSIVCQHHFRNILNIFTRIPGQLALDKQPSWAEKFPYMVLHDHRLYSRPSPCGFCLNSECEIHLICHGQFTTINMQKSRCPNLRKIRLKIAESFTERQPCTNHPLKCPLCTLIVWKCNLRNHITDTPGHPNANSTLWISVQAPPVWVHLNEGGVPCSHSFKQDQAIQNQGSGYFGWTQFLNGPPVWICFLPSHFDSFLKMDPA